MRNYISADMGGLFSKIIEVFMEDAKLKQFDWVDTITKELAVMINAGMDLQAQSKMAEMNVVPILLDVLSMCKESEKGQAEVISRVLNVLGKICKTNAGLEQIVNNKKLILQIVLFYCKESEFDFAKDALIAFHACCKHPEFNKICLEKHGFQIKMFDSYCEVSTKRLKTAFEAKNWNALTNLMASITAFVATFPEK